MGDRERERDRMGWQPRERDRDRRGSWQPPHYDNGPRPPTGYSHNRIDSWQPERDHFERGRDNRERDRDWDRDHDREHERRDRDLQGPDGAQGPNKRRRGGRRQKEKLAHRDRERDRERGDGDHWEPGRPPPPPPQDLDRRGGRGFPPPDTGYANRVRQPSPIARPMRERSASPWTRRAPRSGPPSDGEITRSHTGSRRSRSPRSPSRSRTESVRGRGGSRSTSRSRTPLRNPSEMDTSAVIHEPYVLGSPSPPMEEPPALPPPPPPPQTSSYQRHELPPRPSLDLPPRPPTSQTASPAPNTLHHQLPPRPSVHITTASSSYVASPASASAPTPFVLSNHAGAHSQLQQQQQQQAPQLPRPSNVDPTTGLPIATTLANNPNRGKKPREVHNPYAKNEETRAPPTAEELEKMRKEREDSDQRVQIARCLDNISRRKAANTSALNRLMENKVKEIHLKHQIAVLGIERRSLALRKQLAEEELERAQRGTWEDEIDMSWS